MNEIKCFLNLIPHHMQVSFALYCAIDVFVNLNKETKESALKCIDLTQKWLNDSKSVSNDELKSAAYAAYAAYAVDNAAYAAYAADNAAYAAANAAYAAANAAYAADNAAYEEKISQYENKLKEMIKDLSKLERLIYDIE